MGADECRRLYVKDAETLGRIGRLLVRAELPQIEVRLPRDLAEAAVRAWRRDDDETGDSLAETCEQRLVRHRAADLALVGLSISERGRWENDVVVVELDPVLIGTAVGAADDPTRS